MTTPGRRDRLIIGAVLVLAVLAVMLATPAFVAEDQHGFAPPDPHAAPLAPSYLDLRDEGPLTNRGFSSHIERLQPGEAVTGDRADARRARASNRAYAGAPPTIPHAIDQRDSASCLACHEQGTQLADRLAPAISHPPYSSCLQCHAAEQPDSPAHAGLHIDNAFTGDEEDPAPPLPWTGAPPQMPHGTAMRSNCLSCHGPYGEPGLRTSHPERSSCLQCHAPPAAAGQGPFGRGE